MSAPRRPLRREVDGVLLLDKPRGSTSNGALQRVRRLFEAEKAGHTGTLDPLASGLLPICFGVATRFAQFQLDARKRYLATLRFGVTTTTQDAEGDIVATRNVTFDAGTLAATLDGFVGDRLQTPPLHSALKFEGRPYYDYARRGIDIPRAPRAITLHALRLVDWRAPDALVDVECSKGTYVRVLAADLGEALGCGAHLAGLRRTASGGFDLGEAVTLEALEGMDAPARDARVLAPAVLVRHLAALRVSGEASKRFRHGGSVAVDERLHGLVAVYDGDALLGIAEVNDGIAQPRRNMAESLELAARKRVTPQGIRRA